MLILSIFARRINTCYFIYEKFTCWGLVFSLLLSGGGTAFAEESLILNRKGKFSIPHNHQYSQASIDAINCIRSANDIIFNCRYK